MRILVQRVTRAAVRIDDDVVAAIGVGVVALVGVTHSDTAGQARALARRLHELRLLRGERSVAATGSEILVVSQFTLYGDTRRGRRPSWLAAAPAHLARPLIDEFVAELRSRGGRTVAGVFGAEMQVELVNDGPVTVLLES